MATTRTISVRQQKPAVVVVLLVELLELLRGQHVRCGHHCRSGCGLCGRLLRLCDGAVGGAVAAGAETADRGNAGQQIDGTTVMVMVMMRR